MGGFSESYRRLLEKHAMDGDKNKVLRCFHPDMVPVLSRLAVEFAVCDHWFCSLPGDTWPNRDFLHAGESFGHVNRHEAPIWSNPPTIFALLDKVPAPRPTWRVYTEGVAHIFLYSQLFTMRGRRGSHRQLLADIRGDKLPSYAFVEPDYGLPGAGNSQHPSQARSREEFVNGEQFIADIYNALRETPKVFEKTAFVITYDEHGGFYDHVPPPRTYLPTDKARPYRHGDYRFSYGICGPRVPAVVVSPWVRRGQVDHAPREHSCVAETIRKRFAANVAYPLNDRAEGTDLGPLFDLASPRPPSDWPSVHPLRHDDARELEAQLAAPPDHSDLNPIISYELQTAMQDLRQLLARKGIRL
jgi:phospholipase C